MRIKKILELPEKLPKPYLTIFGFLLVLMVIASLDTITNYDISVSILYLLPIMLIAWRVKQSETRHNDSALLRFKP
jgi:hypothetical protein